MALILLVLLTLVVLLLVAGLPQRGYVRKWGFGPSGLGFAILILLLLLLLGFVPVDF